MEQQSLPIDCNLYDVLEALSTLRQYCEIEYLTGCTTQTGAPTATALGRITNLYAREGEEFLVMDNALQVRLDALVRLNGRTVRGANSAAICAAFRDISTMTNGKKNYIEHNIVALSPGSAT